MTIDEVIYRNIIRLMEENGLTETLCAISCGLNPGFFTKYRSTKNRHFRVCDISKIAALFGVTLDYLCDFKNTSDFLFVKSYKVKERDAKVLMRAFRKLDGESRIKLSEHMLHEIELTKEREKIRKLQSK